MYSSLQNPWAYELHQHLFIKYRGHLEVPKTTDILLCLLSYPRGINYFSHIRSPVSGTSCLSFLQNLPKISSETNHLFSYLPIYIAYYTVWFYLEKIFLVFFFDKVLFLRPSSLRASIARKYKQLKFDNEHSYSLDPMYIWNPWLWNIWWTMFY